MVGPKGTNKSGAFNYIMEGIKNLEKSDIEEVNINLYWLIVNLNLYSFVG